MGDKLQEAFAHGLEQAKKKIGGAVGQAMSAFADHVVLASSPKPVGLASMIRAREQTNTSFLGIGALTAQDDKKLSVNVKVFPRARLDLAVKGYIDEIGRQRANSEREVFEQAQAEMLALVDFV